MSSCMPNDSERILLTQDQLDQYFATLKLPKSRRVYSVAKLSDEEQLDHLSLLIKHQLVNVPFENLSIHYSPNHTVNIDPEFLFQKIVGNGRGRGGYCMENNTLFGTLLRTLGYDLYPVGGRVREMDGRWNGFAHMVHIVTISQNRYVVDVGFGARNLTLPIPIPSPSADSFDPSNVYPHIRPASSRLVLKPLSPQTNRNYSFWVYQHRADDEAEWIDTFAITEAEFLPQDFFIANYYTSSNRHVFFTQCLVIAKFTTADAPKGAEEGELGEINGCLTLFEKGFEGIHRRTYGKSEVVVEKWQGEAHRVRMLKEHFGIVLDEPEQRGIQGLASELMAP